MNHQILKDRYVEYRIQLKKLRKGSIEKRLLKQEMSDFLEEVSKAFGQDVVDAIIKKGV